MPGARTPLEPRDPARVKRSSTANDWLVAPLGYTLEKLGAEAPSFPFPVDTLVALWPRALAGEPRLSQTAISDDGRRIEYVQRSRVFRFPDRIVVALLDMGDGRSSLAIHSGSVYGAWDLGVNRARVERWLERLVDLAVTRL